MSVCSKISLEKEFICRSSFNEKYKILYLYRKIIPHIITQANK